MTFEHYVRSGNKMLRLGYTTGTCAALASYAATLYALTGEAPEEVSLVTPRGLTVEAEIASSGAEAGGNGDEWAPGCFGPSYSASVIKDAGDDADATNGIEIVSAVRIKAAGNAPEAGREQNGQAENRRADSQGQNGPAGPAVTIKGGKGVGKVTMPGLDQPVGNDAINSTPRKMIEESVLRAVEETGRGNGANPGNGASCGIDEIEVTISVPEGEEIAKHTFNPVIGIEGGISIIGTSGIVDPMSEQALIDTIEVNMKQARESSSDLILTPGNYGEDFLKKEDFYSLGIPVVKCSNFIGNALDIATTLGFKRILFVAHIGKLSKVAAGVMNTHSRYADGRNEVFCSHAAINGGADEELAKALMDAATTDACIEALDKAGIREAVIESILSAVQERLERRSESNYEIGALTFSNVYGVLGYTYKGKELVDTWKEEKKKND